METWPWVATLVVIFVVVVLPFLKKTPDGSPSSIPITAVLPSIF